MMRNGNPAIVDPPTPHLLQKIEGPPRADGPPSRTNALSRLLLRVFLRRFLLGLGLRRFGLLRRIAARRSRCRGRRRRCRRCRPPLPVPQQPPQPRSVPALPHAGCGSPRPPHLPSPDRPAARPSGIFSCDRWMLSLSDSPDMSTSMNSGRSLGRQETSTSLRMCDTSPPCDLTPGETASPLKCSGMLMRIFSLSSTR